MFGPQVPAKHKRQTLKWHIQEETHLQRMQQTHLPWPWEMRGRQLRAKQPQVSRCRPVDTIAGRPEDNVEQPVSTVCLNTPEGQDARFSQHNELAAAARPVARSATSLARDLREDERTDTVCSAEASSTFLGIGT